MSDAMQFATEIDDTQIAALAGSISQQLASDPAKREHLAKFALEQVLAWMAGRTSYQSVTEMHSEWLLQLLPMFYPGEAPSAERIFNDFGTPFGRAAYIARVLLEKQSTEWRRVGRKHLLDAVKAKSDEADRNLKNGDASKTVPVMVDAAAYRELKVVLADIGQANPNLIYLTGRTAGPVQRVMGIPSGLFADIVKHLGS